MSWLLFATTVLVVIGLAVRDAAQIRAGIRDGFEIIKDSPELQEKVLDDKSSH